VLVWRGSRPDHGATLPRIFHGRPSAVIPHKLADPVGALLGSGRDRRYRRHTGRRPGFGLSVARQSSIFRRSAGAINSPPSDYHGRGRIHRRHSGLPAFGAGVHLDSNSLSRCYSGASARSLHGRLVRAWHQLSRRFVGRSANLLSDLADPRSTIGCAASPAKPRGCYSCGLYCRTRFRCRLESVPRFLTKRAQRLTSRCS